MSSSAPVTLNLSTPVVPQTSEKTTSEKTTIIKPVTDFAKHVYPFTDEQGRLTATSMGKGLAKLQHNSLGRFKAYILTPFLFIGSAKACPYVQSANPNKLHETGMHPPIETGAYDSNGMYQPEVIQKLFNDYGVPTSEGERVLTEKSINTFLDDRYTESIKDLSWYQVSKRVHFWFVRNVMATFELPILHSMWGVTKTVEGVATKVLRHETLRDCLTNFGPMVEERIREIEAESSKKKS